MSKRAGEFITLDELLAEVGVDAARWSFAARAPSSPIDFDIELARKQSADNPVYYVQYAHARICSILRKADERASHRPHPSRGPSPWTRSRRGSRARCCACRRWSRTPPRRRRRTASPPMPPSSRPCSMPTTATGGWSIRPNRHIGGSAGARGCGPARVAQHARVARHLDARAHVTRAGVAAGPPSETSIASRLVARRLLEGDLGDAERASTAANGVLVCSRRGPAPARLGTGDVGTRQDRVHTSRSTSASSTAVPNSLRHPCCPRRSARRRPRPVRSLETGQAVTAPALRGCRGRVTALAAVGQQDTDVQLAQRLQVLAIPTRTEGRRDVRQRRP